MKKTFLILLFVLGVGWAAAGSNEKFVNVIRLDDVVINPVVGEYITQAIRESERDGAQCLVLELDTPGGLLETTRTIVKEIMGADVPVVAFVSPRGGRAASAGAFIAMASHVAAMAPSTHIGAAHPVNLGEKSTEKSQEDKILNDTVAWMRSLAKERGRNEEWAVDAVVKSISSDEKEAQQKKAVDCLAFDLKQLLQVIDGKKVALPKRTVTLDTAAAAIHEIPMTWRQKVLSVLSNPNIAYLLLLLGFYGLLYEFMSPGFWAPGIAGLICLVLAFYSLQALPISYAGLILIALAILLFVAEVKVQSFGFLAVAGIVSLFLGSLMLIDSPAAFLRVSLYTIFPVVLATAAITIFLVGATVRAHRKPVRTGVEGLMGMVGTADTDIHHDGIVAVHGDIWNAESAKPVKRGESVRIVKVTGLKVTVEKI